MEQGRCYKAQKIIITSVHKKLLMHIINCKTSSEMFIKLKMIFEKDSQDQVCNLMQQFFSFTFEKGSDISMHISRIENIAHRLKMLNQNIEDTMVISNILSTLPEKYKYFCTAWEFSPLSEKTLVK